ncbi:SDR family NAD(P)-dependent oxidoreductase [Pseudonocardia ailaonensis]|uniref:SDR family NAD(P)-dependent oxidoreductase n=1 Tax=Pseudonocardia ailaonensis TaxID=367279 RepID=A0ABN2NA13_9PSEU
MQEGESRAASAMRFDGRVAVVTGAGRGLGRAYARLLAARGARVVVNDLGGPSDGGLQDASPARSQQVVAEIEAAGGSAVASGHDISTLDGARGVIDMALEAWGRIDVVVNNAGTLKTASFADTERSALERTMAVHVLGTWGVTQEAWRHMAEQGYGRVVITTSAAGLYGNHTPPMAAYSAAKGAVYGLTRALAAEGVDLGIRVNGLAPRAFTPMQAEHMTDEAQARRLAHEQPPEAVAPIVALLAHEDCPVNGEIFFAGGGRVARPFMAETPGAAIALDAPPEKLIELLPEILAEDGYTVPQPYVAPRGMR